MSYLLATKTTSLPGPATPHLAAAHPAYDCIRARRACMPPFVFSVSGQVEFRAALQHLTHCPRRDCRSLQRQVITGMTKKLHWLFQETSLLGCIYIQPYLFGAKKIVLGRHNFTAAAHHLAHCPKESCAQLRRAVLLSIRDQVSPNVRPATPVPAGQPVLK